MSKIFRKRSFRKKNYHFGGAFSNHIAAAAALGKEFGIETLGIIRGDELENSWQKNPTLSLAKNGMTFRFVTREIYRDKGNFDEKPSRRISESLVVQKEEPMKMQWGNSVYAQ